MATSGQNDTNRVDVGAVLRLADYTQALNYISSIVLVFACIAVGTVGNTIVCVVYWTKLGKSNPNIFILQLGIFDLSMCLLVLPFNLGVLFRAYTFDSAAVCKICFYSVYMFTSCSLMILISISVDRYNKVCRPLKPGITPRMAKWLFWIAVVIGATMSSFVPFIYGSSRVVYLYRDGLVVNGTTCGVQESVRGSMLHMVHVYLLFATFVTIFSIMTVLYVLVGVEVRRRARVIQGLVQGQGHGQGHPQVHPVGQPSASETATEEANQSLEAKNVTDGTPSKVKALSAVVPEETRNNWLRVRGNMLKEARRCNKGRGGKTAIMLLLVSVVFLVSWLPVWIVLLREALRERPPGVEQEPDGALVRFGRSLFLVNHAVNPIIYSVVNKQFRVDCKLTFRKIRQKLRC